MFLAVLLIPAAPALRYLFEASPLWVFVSGAAAVAVLAEWVRRATEQLAKRVGSTIGGLLNVTFGNIAELILALFVLASGEQAVVQAQITGSIIGTSLLGLGIAILVGCATRDKQVFKPERAGLLSTLLLLSVVALLLPAVFDFAGRSKGPASNLQITDEALSLGVSAVLLVLYVANLVYTLITHRDVFAAGGDASGDEEGTAWGLWTALAVLVGATAAIALEAELVSGALTETAGALHLSPLFLGVVVLGLVGTAADLFAAAWFAHEARMDLVLSICIGSAIQIALVVAPLLVVISWLIGRPMNLVFQNPLHLFAITGTAFIVGAVARDGETTWFRDFCWSESMPCSPAPSSSPATLEEGDSRSSLCPGIGTGEHLHALEHARALCGLRNGIASRFLSRQAPAGAESGSARRRCPFVRFPASRQRTGAR